MFKNIILTTFLMLAFVSFNNQLHSQSTVSKTIVYNGFQACGGCTVCGQDYWCFNTYGSYCGNTAACGTQTFIDPIPPGNIVTSITATFNSAGCGNGHMTATINNNSAIPVVYDDNSGCPCSSNPCSSAGSSSQTFPCGIQDYIYGGANSFELCTGSSVCINGIDLVFTYVPEDQANPAAQPSTINGPQIACEGEQVTYSTPAVANATDYTWSFPAGWSVVSGQNTNSVTVNTGDAGDICVIANNQCGSSQETCLNVTVNTVDPSWTAPGPFCTDDNSVDLDNQITGLAGGTFSGTGVSGNSFDPSSAGIGTHTITYSVTDSDGCTETQNENIVVGETPDFTLSSSHPSSCANSDGSITLSGLTPGEDYSVSYDTGGNTIGPTNFTANGNGEIVISSLGGGSYSNFVVESANLPCSTTDGTSITLVEPNSPPVDAGQDQTICEGDQVILSGSGAGAGATYTWDNGVVDGAAFTPSLGTTTYTVSGTDTDDCVGTDEVDITVVAVDPSWTVPGPFCTDENAVDLENEITGLAGGTFSGTGVTGSFFDPSLAGAGTHTITYSVTDGNGCTETQAEDIEVGETPDFTLSHLDPTSCVNSDGSITISGLIAGDDYLVSYDSGGSTVGPASFTADGNGDIVIPSLSGGAYSNFVVESTSLSCSTTDPTTITLVEPNLPPVDAGQDQTVCEGEQVTLSGTGAGTGATYSWDNGIADGVAFTPNVGTTTYTVSGTDADGCVGSDEVDVTVHALPNVDAGADQEVCEGESLILSGSGATTFTWSDGVIDGIPFEPVADQTYSVVGTDAFGCEDTDQVEVTILPVVIPSLAGDDLKGCEPHSVIFSNTSNSQVVNCTWDFGDGNTANGCDSIPHTYTNSGVYDVTLTVESVDGCIGSTTIDDYIKVVAKPTADFSANPTSLQIDDTKVAFYNQSTGSDSYLWDFGDGAPQESTENPQHNFPNTQSGTYEVILIAYSVDQECSDTTRAIIEVEDELIYYIPSAFTPDEDGYNEIFLPVFTSGYDPQNFVMYIFNRWGEIIFETHDASIGWDGTYGGKIVKDGTYIWKIEFRESTSDMRHIKQGSINVIK